MDRPYNLLFLCTGNSARSIMAEAMANHLGKGRFHAYSAGSHPRGRVHPVALQILQDAGLPTAALRSKPWDEFAGVDAPPMDLIITVCDKAAGEACPVWPGHPVTAHWGIPDPAEVEGTDQRAAFWDAYTALQRRIGLLLALPLESLDELTLKAKLGAIGKTDAEASVG